MNKKFQDLKKRHKFIKNITNEFPEDQIYKMIELLTGDLRQFIQDYEITKLRKSDFLILCSMASKYRPVQPFQFLLKISMLQEKK